MTFHLLNKSCAYLAVPGLYFYYFNKQNKVNAKELGLDDDKLLNSSGLQSKTPRLVDQLPISLLKRSKNESRSLIEAFRVIKNAPGKLFQTILIRLSPDLNHLSINSHLW